MVLLPAVRRDSRRNWHRRHRLHPGHQGRRSRSSSDKLRAAPASAQHFKAVEVLAGEALQPLTWRSLSHHEWLRAGDHLDDRQQPQVRREPGTRRRPATPSSCRTTSDTWVLEHEDRRRSRPPGRPCSSSTILPRLLKLLLAFGARRPVTPRAGPIVYAILVFGLIVTPGLLLRQVTAEVAKLADALA